MIVSVDLWATCQGNIRVRVRVRVGERAAGAIALAGKRSRTRLSAVRVRIRVQVRFRDRARVRTRARVGVAARVRVTSCAGSLLGATGRRHGRAARPRSAARMLAKLATHPPRGQPRHHALLEPHHGRAAGATGSGRSPRPIQQRPQTHVAPTAQRWACVSPWHRSHQAGICRAEVKPQQPAGVFESG